MRSRRIAGAVLVSMLLTGTVSATERAVRTEANRIFREGARLTRQEQYSEALTRFERTLAYAQRPNALWNAGMCHLYLGHRDMALWFMERYLAEVQTSRESLEMQQVMTRISVENSYIADMDQRRYLADLLREAADEASDGEATPAEASRQVYGSGLPNPEATERSELARDYGSALFRSGLDQLTDQNWDNSRTFFERSLAYRMLRNAAYNIATVHLDNGHRDLAVHFYRLYIADLPEVQGSAGVAGALRAIEDSPPRIGNQARRDELSNQLARAVDLALGAAPTRAPTQADGPTTAPE